MATRVASAKSLSGPARIVLAWIGFILLGAALLTLPAASQQSRLGWYDACFTSTSAVCVTGLSTIDIGQSLSLFGQTVVLILMQVGGIGIGVLSTFLLVAAGRTTLSHQYEMENALASVRVRPLRLLAWAVPIVVLVEAIGAVILVSRTGSGGWQAIFHSVSAFCNAGFCLFPDSLARYHADPVITVTFALLIILGGVGFITLSQVGAWLKAKTQRRPRPLYLHSKAVLIANGWLWLIGLVLIAILEWNGALAGLSTSSRLFSSFFASVTTRTAGFTMIDVGQLRGPTLLVTMVLMLIGGAPGSCAGGVKVTTIVVILAAMRARLRGSDSVSLMKRTVPNPVISRAFHVVSLSLLFLAIVVFALSVTEESYAIPSTFHDRITGLTFEAVSALGTVGLSTGLTPYLSTAGKVVIMITMFVGRLGPLAIALAILGPRPASHFEYPKEEIALG